MSETTYTPCHFCGTETDAAGVEYGGERHWLSDCRPDLVEHEIGPLCTWPEYTGEYAHLNEKVKPGCYGFQKDVNGEFGAEHIHFHKDGPC